MRIPRITGAFLTLLVMTTTARADAQDLRLTGRVLSDSAKPLQNVRVVLEGTGIGVITDSDGNYAFIYSAARLHGQTGKLTASLLGYRATSVDVVLAGTSNVQNFALASEPIHLIVDPVILPPPYTLTPGDFVRERADVVHAAGLQDLWSNHRSGQRELRIWTARSGSLELLRMVERSNAVHGELFDYTYWHDERERDLQCGSRGKRTRATAHTSRSRSLSSRVGRRFPMMRIGGSRGMSSRQLVSGICRVTKRGARRFSSISASAIRSLWSYGTVARTERGHT